MRYSFFYLILLFSFLSCSSDDDNEYVANACDGVSQIEEVTVSNVEVVGYVNDDQRGYLLTATITNNTNNNIQEGQTIIIFSVNNIPFRHQTIGGCGEISSKSTCEFESRWTIESGESIEPNPTVACYYYEL